MLTSCPNCGEPLVAVPVGDGTTAPWLSPTCSRGWWDAELAPAARVAWDPDVQDHDPAVAPALADAVLAEAAAAAAAAGGQ